MSDVLPAEDPKLHALAEEDPVYGTFNKLLRLTRNEDDRGLVLGMAAFSEDCLGQLLLAYLRPGKPSLDLLEGFNAPLGTLSARIKACAAIGLISEIQYTDLELSRKVRNEFAHKWEGCSLSDPAIALLVNRMSDSRISKAPPESLKAKFAASMSSTLAELLSLLHNINEDGQRVPSVAFHLSLGPPPSDQDEDAP